MYKTEYKMHQEVQCATSWRDEREMKEAEQSTAY